MRRYIRSLMRALRRGTRGSAVECARSHCLAIETLESRTVLSANFGGYGEVFDFSTRHDVPRLNLNGETVEVIRAGFSADAPSLLTNAERALDGGKHAQSVGSLEFDASRLPPPDRTFRDFRPPLGARTEGTATPVSSPSMSPEDYESGSMGSDKTEPLMIKSNIAPSLGADRDGSEDDNPLASTFSSLQPPRWEAFVERIAETRQLATSPFVAPTSNVADDGDGALEAFDADSLLASYATLASSIGERKISTDAQDAAFDGYSSLSDSAADYDAHLRRLAEQQAHDPTTTESTGLMDAINDNALDVEQQANSAANKQADSVEKALRTFAARRSGARSLPLIMDLSEQSRLDASTIADKEASVNRVADDPGGMILLQPLAVGDDLFAAGNAAERAETSVEMDATIGTFQAFDVSVDAAPAAIIESSSASGGPSEGRDAQSSGPTDRQAASGLGGLAIGALAFVAKRRRTVTRRKPR